MKLLDKFMSAMQLNDSEFDDDDEFLDDDELEEYEEEPKSRFFKKFKDDNDDLDYLDEDDENLDDEKPVKKAAKTSSKPESVQKSVSKMKAAKKSSKVTPIRKKGMSYGMEVNVIRPTSMEDTRDIADTLLDDCTVVLNLEGLDMDIAQRIIDFTCGACYSLSGSLQKISSYIFILTPPGVEISGDFEDILSGSFDLPSMKAQY